MLTQCNIKPNKAVRWYVIQERCIVIKLFGVSELGRRGHKKNSTNRKELSGTVSDWVVTDDKLGVCLWDEENVQNWFNNIVSVLKKSTLHCAHCTHVNCASMKLFKFKLHKETLKQYSMSWSLIKPASTSEYFTQDMRWMAALEQTEEHLIKEIAISKTKL